jgi:hydrogenase expression/formation protein HypD
MRFIEEYRDAEAAQRFAEAIRKTVTRDWTIMEICGGQTHAIMKFGIDELLPPAGDPCCTVRAVRCA